MDLETFMNCCKFWMLPQFITIPLQKLITNVCSNDLIKVILLEIIATAELCAMYYEITAENLEQTMHVMCIFVITIIWLIRWGGIACPNAVLEYMIITKTIRYYGIFIIFAEIIGSYLAFKFMHMLWNIFQLERSSVGCSTIFHEDLALHAFINEWLLTAIHRLTIYAITDLGKYLSPNFILIGQALVTTIFGTTGFFFTGSYNNPVLGACMRYGCTGTGHFHSLLVYWIASFCGSLHALFILRLYKKFEGGESLPECQRYFTI